MEDQPVIFTPDNEPYLGRQSVYHFDQIITSCLDANQRVAPYTRAHFHSLSELQHAECQTIPHAISLALSIRELVRQGYLFSALVLLRPLIERAAIISYLCENPQALPAWRDGWKHSARPSLATMLSTMSEKADTSKSQVLCSHFNHIVHGDPIGASHGTVALGGDSYGFSPSKQLKNPDLCDDICLQGACYLIVLMARMIQIFADAPAVSPHPGKESVQ
jgi:hypothetical protein